MATPRFIEFDSAYRNRNLYPNPGQFTVQLAYHENVTNGTQAYDPVSAAYPYYPSALTSVSFAGGTNVSPVLDANASNATNAYINSYLYDITTNEIRKILEYDGATKACVIDAPFGAGWQVTDQFNIRQAPPLETDTLVAAGGTTAMTLSASSSSTLNYYKGCFLYFMDGPCQSEAKLIVSYNGTTKIATTTPFAATPAPGNKYQILQFTRDAFSNLNYSGSTVSQNEVVCCAVRLLRLTLPNVNLWSGYGNRPSFYPYMYVQLTTTSSPNTSIIYSNNPNSSNALFSVSMLDDKEPSRSAFLHYEAERMIQTIKFKPNDNFNFAVFLPNKEPYRIQPDTVSPEAPNPMLQVYALFEFKKL